MERSLAWEVASRHWHAIGTNEGRDPRPGCRAPSCGASAGLLDDVRVAAFGVAAAQPWPLLLALIQRRAVTGRCQLATNSRRPAPQSARECLDTHVPTVHARSDAAHRARASRKVHEQVAGGEGCLTSAARSGRRRPGAAPAAPESSSAAKWPEKWPGGRANGGVFRGFEGGSPLSPSTRGHEAERPRKPLS